MSKDDFFSDDNIAKSNWMKFEKVGDSVKGTLVGKHLQKSNLPTMPDQEIFELKTDEGVINVGFANDPAKNNVKTYILDRMRNVKFGQIVGFMFKKEIPSKTKGYAPAKSIEVYVSGFDPDYNEEKEVTDEIDVDEAFA